MVEYLPEAGYDRSIDLRFNKTVGQRGRHTQSPIKPDEIVGVGVDIAKNTLDVAGSNLNETSQFDNDYEVITQAVPTLPD